MDLLLRRYYQRRAFTLYLLPKNIARHLCLFVSNYYPFLIDTFPYHVVLTNPFTKSSQAIPLTPCTSSVYCISNGILCEAGASTLMLYYCKTNFCKEIKLLFESSGFAALILNNKAYKIGGYNTVQGSIKNQYYDLLHYKLIAFDSLVTQRFMHSLVAIKHSLYCIGGTNLKTKELCNSIEICINLKWKSVIVNNTAIERNMATYAYIGASIVVIGGYNNYRACDQGCILDSDNLHASREFHIGQICELTNVIATQKGMYFLNYGVQYLKL